MAKNSAVQVKAITDTTVTVAGYGVLFGGADLDGETFTKSTDFMLDLVPQKLVLYDHGMNDGIKGNIIGRVPVTAISEDDDGLWIEAELERSAAYMDSVLSLIDAGKLGWSSGSVGHLVSRDGRQIKRWPVVEFSLTPTPAEPRTLGVEMLKSLAECAPALMQLATEPETATVDIEDATPATPEAAPEDNRARVSATAATAAKSDSQPIEHDEHDEHVEEEMSDEVKAAVPAKEEPQNADNSAAILAAIKTLSERVAGLESQPVNELPVQTPTKGAPTYIKSLGDTQEKAISNWYRTGDFGGVKHLQTGENEIAIKASNATDMNITTNADGGYAVPTGHYQGIVARMHEEALYQRLGCMPIPGKGTTVNVPVDNEDDGEWVATNEAATFDTDSPAIDLKAMTLVKYTKYIPLSAELLEDEDSQVLSFVENWVGTGLARTHNNLLVTEVLSGGTAGLTLDAAAAIGATEIPELEYLLKEEYTSNASWLMRRATEGVIRKLQGDDFVFNARPAGSDRTTPHDLSGYPVFKTSKMPAVGAGNKSLVFGNFRFVGVRTSPSITFLRNPYLLANTGQIALHYYTRIDYKVLQAEALQYATHPTA